MANPLAALAKRLNRARRNWSTDRDRAFHDALFAAQVHDPMSDAYPGRLTIRRFADLAAARVRENEAVLDLGCGPGEITCELARRLPRSSFVGVDHSASAIQRAERLAGSLNLSNVRFKIGNLEDYLPDRPVGMVAMFDAFHHLLDPGRFVRRIGELSDRFFLVEPAGNWIGQWQRALDLDWLAEALFVIRDRLEYQFGLAPPSQPGPPPVREAGEPTEHRYSLADFERFFEGFGLEIAGTIAGLERYGANPTAASPLRDDVGRSVYRLVVDLEELLRRHNLDLAAKHWAIYAERGRDFPRRSLPALAAQPVQRPLAGPYDVAYESFEGPREVRAGSTIEGVVTLVNRGWRTWDSGAADEPILLSYVWLDARGEPIGGDGLRSPLPRPVAPGERCAAALHVQCPATSGHVVLLIDLVHEHVTWFSQAGVPPLRVPVHVIR
jgi:SAM-dependent methyltransferase